MPAQQQGTTTGRSGTVIGRSCETCSYRPVRRTILRSLAEGAAYKANAGASIVAALDGLARTLAVELAPIRVNVVSPGVVDSPTWDFLPSDARASVLHGIGAGLPVGRVGTASELAQAGRFLIANGFATGTVLQIDGGDVE
ncbi:MULTISPECIES: SDR family oxidoreductase [Cupriavidus]|uniref:SDR family oxidoreductase n=1 Tax=Cupriavidus TaxID=106589 RepID=UPI0009B87C15|nr:SDR family oxidoreductase [Cupriavidus metallidurans]MDE4920539.1 SDR family oxidoreductase [Cupriavidus metallidurans]UBM07661.1 SDR family oxidoreductase [Cupriavidus metallidurans]